MKVHQNLLESEVKNQQKDLELYQEALHTTQATKSKDRNPGGPN